MTSHSSRANCDKKKESKYDKSNLNPPSEIPTMQPQVQWIKIFSEETFLFFKFIYRHVYVIFELCISRILRKKNRDVLLKSNLLIIQHNIGSPNVVGRHMQLLNSSILHWIPDEFVVEPKLKIKMKR